MAGFPSLSPYQSRRDPLETLRDLDRLRQFRLSEFDQPEPDYDLLSRLTGMEPIAKGNVTRQRRLEAMGVPTQEMLEPTEPTDRPNFLDRILGALDYPGSKVRQHVAAPILESITGRSVANPAAVSGEDLAKQITGNEEDSLANTILGFTASIATDPLTYLSGGVGAGAKLLKGGKALATLNKVGTRALGSKAGVIAERLAKKAGTQAPQEMPKAYDIARRVFLKDLERGSLPTEFIDKGGLKIAGKTVIPGGAMRDAFETFRNAPVIKEVADALAPTLDHISRIFKAPIYNFEHANVLRRYHGLVNEQADIGVKAAVGTATTYGFKSRADREALSTAMERMKSVTLPQGMKVPDKAANVDAFWNNPDVRKAVRTELDAMGTFTGREAKAIDALRDYNRMFTGVRDEMNAAGVDVNGFVEYFIPHVYKFRGVGARAKQIPGAALSKLDLPGRGKPRIIETIDDARDILKQMGIEADIKLDMASLYAAYHQSAYMAIAKKRMLGEMAQKGLVKIKSSIPTQALVAQNIRQAGDAGTIGMQAADEVAGYIQDLPANQFGFMAPKGAQPFEYVRRNIKEGIDEIRWNGQLITGPAPVLRSLENLANVGLAPDEIKWMGSWFNALQRGFKKYVTTPWPSFHVRNFYSDMQRAMYDVGIAAFDPRLQGKTIATMLNKSGFIDTPMGKIPLEQVRDWFVEYGGMSYDIGRRDITKTVAERMRLATKTGKLNLTGQYMKAMEKGGVYVENHTKMMLFIRNIERGMAPDEALNRALKFVFDYGAASAGDRYFRQAIPFWTFMKKNVAFQAKRFVEAPGQQMATIRALQTLEKAIPQAAGTQPLTPEEKQALPDFIKENVAIPFWRKANGEALLLTNIDIGIQQLNELFSLPNGFTWESLRRTAEKNAANVTPLIKNLAEIVANRDFFFGSPLSGESIDPETGRRMTPFERQKDLPSAFALLPGISMQQTGDGSTAMINPYARKGYDILGLGRTFSEAGKLTRLGEAFQGEDTVPKVASILDILTAAKIRPENLRERQRQDISGRILGRSQVLAMQQRREKRFQ